MTPKEKAEQLYIKFAQKANSWIEGKRCALFAVDEIISCLKDDDLYIQGETNINEIIDFWQQVKQEIENL